MEQPQAFIDAVARFVEGGPSPGAEAALRRLTAELQQGEPDYSRMSPGLAAVFRANIGAVRQA
jgi:hypothetical protein